MDSITDIVDSILLDYQRQRSIDRQDVSCQPDKNAVIDIVNTLLRIVYPGHDRDDLPRCIREAVDSMTRQLARSLGVSEREARQTSLMFFRQIPSIRAMAQTDVEAAYDGDPAATSHEEIIFCYPGLFAVTVYRLAHILYTLNVPMLPRIMTEHAHCVTGIDIHPGADIGSHFFIDHGTGTVIGETTVIGRGVRIYQGVTLGGLSTRGGQSLRGKKRHPTIEDNVTIYAGASILGGDTVIGRNSIIGANAFITSSIPPCTTVTNQDQELRLRPRNCPDCNKTVI